MKMVLSSSILMSSETFVEEQKMGKLQCEYICFMQEYFCNYYIHDTDTHTCTWGKVNVKNVCQNVYIFIFRPTVSMWRLRGKMQLHFISKRTRKPCVHLRRTLLVQILMNSSRTKPWKIGRQHCQNAKYSAWSWDQNVTLFTSTESSSLVHGEK